MNDIKFILKDVKSQISLLKSMRTKSADKNCDRVQ